jgi:pimeloyl-ACP methyl ester carboxylesterase
MNTPLKLGSAAIALVLAAATAVVAYGRYGESVYDPESARCNTPRVVFAAERVYKEYREVRVRFTCVGATLAGTLTMPKGAGPHPAVVWVHGSGPAYRLNWDGAPFVRAFVRAGVAVFGYDKRGVGGSSGVCCPGDEEHFNLLAADADGAVAVLWSRTDIDHAHVGFIGASQAGWVVPLATARSTHRVAFTALVDAPVTSTHEEHVYSRLAGEDEAGPLSAERKAKADRSLATTKPSGFDPAPYLAHMTSPGLWLYGARDKSVPTTKCVARLWALQASGKDVTVRVLPDVGHGLLDGPGDPRAVAALVRWVSAR